MAFELQRFVRQTEAFNSGAQVVDSGIVNGPALYTYESATDTIAQIGTAGYFDSEWRSLCVGDFFICTGLDASNMFIVDAIDQTTHVVTLASFGTSGSVGTANIQDGAVTAPKLASDAVTTIKILNANVTLAKLAAGIAPAGVIKFMGQYLTTGGSASEAITVTGAVAATDRAFVQVVDQGTNSVTVLEAVVTNNTLTVTFSADPGADCTINYQLIRAAS